MLSATIPTKMAASHSMALMKRSAWFFFKRSPRPSHRRLVLHQRLPERVQHLLRVAAGLLHAFGPLAFDRHDRGTPRLQLFGRELVDLVTGLGRDLRATRDLEVGPGA